jgi:hypothetical protein
MNFMIERWIGQAIHEFPRSLQKGREHVHHLTGDEIDLEYKQLQSQ